MSRGVTEAVTEEMVVDPTWLPGGAEPLTEAEIAAAEGGYVAVVEYHKELVDGGGHVVGIIRSLLRVQKYALGKAAEASDADEEKVAHYLQVVGTCLGAALAGADRACAWLEEQEKGPAES